MTPAAFLLVVGVMLVCGLEGIIPNLAWTGGGSLATAFAFGLAALFWRQGWD